MKSTPYGENQTSSIMQILEYAGPISINRIIACIEVFIISAMVSRFSQTEFAELALVNAIYFATIAFCGPCIYYISIFMSNYRTKNNPRMVAQIAWNGIWLALIIGIIAALLLWDADKLLIVSGLSDEVSTRVIRYFHYLALSLIPFMLRNAFYQINYGLAHPMINTIFTVIRLPITLFFSYVLILYFHQGMLGAAKALLASHLICLTMLIIHCRYSENWKYLTQSAAIIFHWHSIKKIFYYSVYIGMQVLFEVGAISCSTFLMGYLGDIALDASQIATRYGMFMIEITIGIEQAVSIRISEACGRNQYYLIDKFTNSALILVITLFSFITIIYLLIPKQLIGLFINEHNLRNYPEIQLTHYLMLLTIPTMLIDGVKNVLVGSLRGLDNSRSPMMISSICVWLISIPGAYLTGVAMSGGAIGLKIGFSLGFVVASIFLWFYFKQFKTKFILQNTT